MIVIPPTKENLHIYEAFIRVAKEIVKAQAAAKKADNLGKEAG